MSKSKSIALTPLSDRVLIEPANKKGETKTASGIIIPGKEADHKQEQGVIVAVGRGRIDTNGVTIPLESKVGDTVLFKRGYDVEEVELDGTEYLLTSESNVLAIVAL